MMLSISFRRDVGGIRSRSIRTTRPSENTMIVGMWRTSYVPRKSREHVPTSTLRISRFLPHSSSIWASIGAYRRHGPHSSEKNRTTVGALPVRMDRSRAVSSVTFVNGMVCSGFHLERAIRSGFPIEPCFPTFVHEPRAESRFRSPFPRITKRSPKRDASDFGSGGRFFFRGVCSSGSLREATLWTSLL